MQAGEQVAIYFRKGGKRMRGVKKPQGYGNQVRIPDSCNAGDLAELLEFTYVCSSSFQHILSIIC